METEHSMRLVVTEAGHTVADVLVDEPQALLGSASHCDVRLGPDKVAPEQLLFEVRGSSLYAEVRSSRPQVLNNLSPFHSGRVRQDAVLTIGTLEVRATLEQSLRGAKKNQKEGVKPTFVATCLLLVVLLVVAVVRLTRQKGGIEAPVAPALFTGTIQPCPEPEGEAALSTAYELLAQADGKRERAPFLPEAGLEAVPLYRTAAACLEAGGDTEGAKEIKRTAARMTAFVERDYHLHQVRVYRAIESGDTDLLTQESKVLASYLHNDTSAYGSWLDRIQRDLEVQASGKKKKKKK